jgi:hypothetical protein
MFILILFENQFYLRNKKAGKSMFFLGFANLNLTSPLSGSHKCSSAVQIKTEIRFTSRHKLGNSLATSLPTTQFTQCCVKVETIYLFDSSE